MPVLPISMHKWLETEEAACRLMEVVLWPHGLICPSCHSKEPIYSLNNTYSKPSILNPKGLQRYGLKKCGKCQRQFTIRVGNLLEGSHVSYRTWLHAIDLINKFEQGMSVSHLSRELGISRKSAGLIRERIRKAFPEKINLSIDKVSTVEWLVAANLFPWTKRWGTPSDMHTVGVTKNALDVAFARLQKF
jgi:transposase-like protein